MKKTETMKKVLPLLVLILALGFVPAGCGKTEPAQTGSVNPEAEASAIGRAALQKMVEEAQAAINEQGSGVEGMVDVAVTSRGESMVWTYTYLIDVDLSATEGLDEIFEATLDTQIPTFDLALEELKKAGLQSPSVITEYFTKDGEVIWSKEYTGK